MYIIAQSYLRFCKTNGIHTGILLPVSIFDAKKLLLFTRPIPVDNYIYDLLMPWQRASL